MIILRSMARAAYVTVCIALVSACANLDVSRYTPTSGASQSVSAISKTHPIAPNCCGREKTLFVSDSLGEAVQMFDFPSGAYIGSLPAPPEGWALPTGMCSDDKGNVYIANEAELTVDVYAHDGTFLRALKAYPAYPVACAFDRSTGDLAVSSLTDVQNATGGISIYTNASGTATRYTDPSAPLIYFLGYMGKTGVLYFDAETNNSQFVYGSLRKGKFQTIPLKGATIKAPGTVAYSARTRSMNLGDQWSAVLYQVSPNGTVSGSTRLKDATIIGQGTIKGHRFVGPDNEDAKVNIYAYPAGGKPKVTISGYFESPSGSAVSPDDSSDDVK
jgi:hypothetical protein